MCWLAARMITKIREERMGEGGGGGGREGGVEGRGEEGGGGLYPGF